jgi:U1 small nuclear ribonucleoprotein
MTKMMKESVKTGHPTGLPDKLLRLFAPNEPMRYVKENCKEKKPPAVPWQGIGQYVKEFAVPGDPEYEPKGAGADFPEPRLYNNKEYDLQVRLDEETKREK